MTLSPEKVAEDRFETWTDWSGYLQFLDLLADRRIRITYDRGRLELLSPSKQHEWSKKALGWLLECLLDATETDYEPGGSMTFKREVLDRGLEPDECYWITRQDEVAGRMTFDAETDPPPDLVIEVEVSRSALNRLGIYAVMGVPEVWRYAVDGKLVCHHLVAGSYETAEFSWCLPWLAPNELETFVDMARKQSKHATLRNLRQWVQLKRTEP